MINKVRLWVRRSWMPSYKKGDLSVYSDIQDGVKEVGKFHIETKPLGFRGIKGLSWLLHFVPYITGSKPKFHYKITRIGQLLDDTFGITLFRLQPQNENVVHFTGVNIQDHYEDGFEDDNWISTSGKYSYELEIHVSVYSAKIGIVTFKAVYQEDVTFTILSVISLLFAAGLGSLLTWLFMRGH